MKHHITKLFYILIVVCFCSACGDSTSAKTSSSTQKTEAVANANSLPIIPKELLKNLWDNCTGIDYLFHNLPFSMSQTDQSSIRTNLSYFDNKPVPQLSTTCKPIGRIFFQAKGDVAHDVDLYYSDGCKYFVLVENEKPKYANLMSETGDKFFNNMILQAMKTAKNNFGG